MCYEKTEIPKWNTLCLQQKQQQQQHQTTTTTDKIKNNYQN